MNNDLAIHSASELDNERVTAKIASSRQVQEVQAAMYVAKTFKRDETASVVRIMNACKRVGLAEKATYEFPRGGTTVSGPSIRLAEAIAQNWGNIDFGTVELEQRDGESTVMSYCWDLETNTRQTKVFTVPHIRQTKNGAIALTDPRDIYELVANQGARRVRSCILSIIPKDVVDDALEQCQKTLRDNSEAPLIDRVRKMVMAFQDNFGVPQSCLEDFIGCRVDAFTEHSIVRLRGVFTSIRDGVATREQFFSLPTNNQDSPKPSPPNKTKQSGKNPQPSAPLNPDGTVNLDALS